jgi:hypothetical protein
VITLDDLLRDDGLLRLRNLFYNPEAFRPEKTVEEVTEEAAGAAQLAQEDRHQFEYWALGLIRAQPISLTDASGQKGRKGADQDIVSPN